MNICTTQVFRRDFFPGRGFDQRRPSQKDRARPPDDHRFVAHRRDVSAACRAASHHAGNLWDACRAHPRLIVEDAAKIVAVREDFSLHRQKCAAAVHQIDAGQIVLQSDLLRAQVLPDSHRIIRAALDGRIVSDDQAFRAAYATNAGDDASRRRDVLVKFPSGERRDL